jgi:hypothetical protein
MACVALQFPWRHAEIFCHEKILLFSLKDIPYAFFAHPNGSFMRNRPGYGAGP